MKLAALSLACTAAAFWVTLCALLAWHAWRVGRFVQEGR